MIRSGERVFVDTGAWIALAVTRDSLHERARSTWVALERAGARLHTSTAIILERFTYLDRKGSRDLATRWLASLADVRHLRLLDFDAGDVKRAAGYMGRGEFHKLSLVDAVSFVLMQQHRFRLAFSFDTHFAIAGFELV